MKKEYLEAILLLSGVEPSGGIYEIANQYLPDNEHYSQLRRENPWWLVLTKSGPITIGWRKNVISISWVHTSIRKIVTSDDVTKDEFGVHAWSYSKAVSYLSQISNKLNLPSEPVIESQHD